MKTKKNKKLDALNWLRTYEWVNPKFKEKLDTIEKNQKTLEIIIKKNVDIQLLKDSENQLDYNWCVHTKNRMLTKKQYNSIRNIINENKN